MKIVDILTKRIDLKFKKVFRVTYAAKTHSYAVYVKILTDEGIYGLGEALPNIHVTGETIDSVISAVEHMKQSLIGLDPTDIENIHKQMDKIIFANPAAKAGVDIACYDIIGKVKKMPVYRVLGSDRNKITTDMTIGINSPEEMAQDALLYVSQGFRYLKVKGGINHEDDLLAIKLIREAVGDKIEIRTDFNQGYTIDGAVVALKQMKEYNVLEAEQPLPAWDVLGMSKLKKISPIPIMIDEGAHSPEQVITACELDACDLVNIKLMKCGGIYPALKIAEIAKKYGKKCIVGCMTESKLAISAGAAVVSSAYDNMIIPDLDGFLSLADENAGVTGGLSVDGDTFTLSEKYGFGFDEYKF